MFSFLVGVGAFFFFLLILALKDYREYEIRRRLNRESLRKQEIKFNMFSKLNSLYLWAEKTLKEANISNIDADTFILIIFYFAVALFIFILYTKKFIIGLFITILSYFGLKSYISSRKLNVKHKMEKQFGAFAEDMAVTLKTTPSLYTALKNTAKHIENPLKEVIYNVIENVDSGKSIDEALMILKEKTGSTIIRDWVDSITFARTSKSDLAPVCEHAAKRINDKITRSNKIRTITAKTKGTIVLILLIVAGSAFMTISSSPDFKQAYSTPAGQILLSILFGIMLATTYYIVKSIDKMVKS